MVLRKLFQKNIKLNPCNQWLIYFLLNSNENNITKNDN
jgi:hypothetical protein